MHTKETPKTGTADQRDDQIRLDSNTIEKVSIAWIQRGFGYVIDDLIPATEVLLHPIIGETYVLKDNRH
jgi:hypothetical protein